MTFSSWLTEALTVIRVVLRAISEGAHAMWQASLELRTDGLWSLVRSEHSCSFCLFYLFRPTRIIEKHIENRLDVLDH